MDIFKAIGEFIGSVYEWIIALPDMLDMFLARLIVWLITGYFEMKKELLEFVYYNIGQPVIANLNLSEQINSAFSGIHPDIAAVLSYVGAFESMNIILSAYVTRFVLGFIPWG